MVPGKIYFFAGCAFASSGLRGESIFTWSVSCFGYSHHDEATSPVEGSIIFDYNDEHLQLGEFEKY